jgi:hypothetical protein
MGANAATPCNSVLQQRTLEALGYASNEAVHTMIRVAYAAENEETRRSALLAIGRSGDTRAFEALGEIATDYARTHLKRATDLAAAAEEAPENAEMMGDVRKMLDNIDNLDID